MHAMQAVLVTLTVHFPAALEALREIVGPDYVDGHPPCDFDFVSKEAIAKVRAVLYAIEQREPPAPASDRPGA